MYAPGGVCTPGSIVAWAAAAAPFGWLLCDGSAVSRTTYSALFAVLGVVYGVGDGSTTFNLPDLRGRFPIGKAAAGTAATLGETGGTIDHVHTADPPSTVTSGPSSTSIQFVGVVSVASDTHTHTVDIASFNTGSANPPYLALNFIVRT